MKTADGTYQIVFFFISSKNSAFFSIIAQ